MARYGNTDQACHMLDLLLQRQIPPDITTTHTAAAVMREAPLLVRIVSDDPPELPLPETPQPEPKPKPKKKRGPYKKHKDNGRRKNKPPKRKKK